MVLPSWYLPIQINVSQTEAGRRNSLVPFGYNEY